MNTTYKGVRPSVRPTIEERRGDKDSLPACCDQLRPPATNCLALVAYAFVLSLPSWLLVRPIDLFPVCPVNPGDKAESIFITPRPSIRRRICDAGCKGDQAVEGRKEGRHDPERGSARSASALTLDARRKAGLVKANAGRTISALTSKRIFNPY